MSKENENCLLTVRVQPGASRTEIAGPMTDGSVKVRLKAAPVGGKANRELVTLLASVLRVPTSSVRIVRGLTSRRKSVTIEKVRRSKVEELLKGKLGRDD